VQVTKYLSETLKVKSKQHHLNL